MFDDVDSSDDENINYLIAAGLLPGVELTRRTGRVGSIFLVQWTDSARCRRTLFASGQCRRQDPRSSRSMPSRVARSRPLSMPFHVPCWSVVGDMRLEQRQVGYNASFVTTCRPKCSIFSFLLLCGPMSVECVSYIFVRLDVVQHLLTCPIDVEPHLI